MDSRLKVILNGLISSPIVQHSCITFLTILFCASGLTGQKQSIQRTDIEKFTSLLKSNGIASPWDTDDLTNKKITIYWLYPDRRAAMVFYNRISSYLGHHNNELKFGWDWPDDVQSSNDHFSIFIYNTLMTWPPDFDKLKNTFRIAIGKSKSENFYGLTLPNTNPGLMDLAAQYIMKGITLDEQGLIRTGERLSFLPPEYLGLDRNYIYQKLDSILQMGLDSAAYPGASVYVSYKGSVIYHRDIGYHTYDKDFRVRSQDLFDLASLTKVVGGVNALMSLHDQGVFQIDKSLGDYFPYFRHSDKGKLDMKRILTHSAGLMPYMVYYSMAMKDNGKYARNTISSSYHGKFTHRISDSIFISEKFNRYIYKAIKDSPLTTGNEYKYSGLFFLLIPDLILEKTGQTLDEYLFDKILQPLGAHNTTYNPLNDFNIHQIVPTEVDKTWRNQLVHGQVHDEAAAVLGGVSGNAGMFSTGIDLVKIGETWRRKGTYGGKRYWSEETVETFTHCYYCNEGNRRALGFDRPPLPDQPANSYMSPFASQESFGHSGFTGTMIWVDPTSDYTFVFLSNRVNPTRDNSKIYSLNIRPALHSVLYEALKGKH